MFLTQIIKGGQNMQILILDDDQNRLDIFKRNLEVRLNAYDNIYVTTASEAMLCLDLHPDFSYIFLDHDLGGLEMEWNPDNCGMNVVDYIIRIGYNKGTSIVIHSWNIPRGQEMTQKLQAAGYSVIHQPGVWHNIGK